MSSGCEIVQNGLWLEWVWDSGVSVWTMVLVKGKNLCTREWPISDFSFCLFLYNNKELVMDDASQKPRKSAP